jgi:hypothetical protein
MAEEKVRLQTIAGMHIVRGDAVRVGPFYAKLRVAEDPVVFE